MAKTPKLSLIIPARGKEPLLQQTIDCAIKGALNKVEIIVVDNGLEVAAPCGSDVRVIKSEISGTGAARHAGVLAALAPVIVTIDAHVRLCDFWDDYVLDHFERKAWAKTVACGHVGGLATDFSVEKEACYTGAQIHWQEINGSETRLLVPKWSDNSFGSRIGAVMGAFYAFKKSWYEKMAGPWSVFASWGCDEETISIASYLAGGDCRLMAEHVRSWHLFGHPERIRYTTAEIATIAANRFLLFRLFPFAFEDLAAVASQHPEVNAPLSDQQTKFAQHYSDKSAELADYLGKYVIGYQEWRDSIVQKTATPPKRRKPPQRLPTVPLDQCDQCDAINSFICVRTEEIRRYKCKVCGRNAWRQRPEDQLKFTINNI